MRFAFLITPTYQRRSDLPSHIAGPQDAAAMRARLSDTGYDFDVMAAPNAGQIDEWLGETLSAHRVGPEDPVILYASAFTHLDDAGEVSLYLGGGDEEAMSRLPLARLRAALSTQGVRSATLVLDLVHMGQTDSVLASEHVSGVRRVFAPELSGYSMLCAVRSLEQRDAGGSGPSPFTALFLRALEKPEARNKVGAVLVSRVMEAMREDPDLYTDIPCFSLIPGRRDLTVYSATAASHLMNAAPPSSRLSSPSSVRTVVKADDAFSEAESLMASGDLDAATNAYKKVLLLISDDKTAERVQAYVALAAIRVSQGRRREAALSYRKALAIEPAHHGALQALAEVHRAEGEFGDAAKTRQKLLDATDDAEQRFEVLLSLAGDHEKGKNLDGAIDALEAARALRPDEAAVLARLAQVYDSAKRLDKVVDIKVAIAELKGQPEEVARSLVLAGDFAAERAGDSERALSIYASALDQDPLTPRAFDTIAEVLTGRGDSTALEAALLAQSVRLDRVGAHAAEAEVWRELASLRQNQLGDLIGAIEALDRCVERVPTDVEARVTLAELLAKADEVEAAVASLEIAAWHAPGRAETYRLLHQLSTRLGRVDQAYSAAAALELLGEADLDEDMFYEQYHPDGIVRPSHSLNGDGWTRLYPHGQAEIVGAILDAVAPQAIEYKLGLLRKGELLPVLDPEARQDPQKSTVSLTRTFVWASTVLDVPLPEIYVGDEVPGGIAAVPAELPTALVGRSVLSGRSLVELAFLVGRDITYYRPAHYILVLYSSLKELTALFLAAVATVRPKQSLPEASRREITELSKFLRRELSAEAIARLEELVERFETEGARADLVAWARSIEIAATRAGLLLCGDLKVVSDLLEADDRVVGDLTPRDRIHDLLPFSVSHVYAELRGELGIAAG